MDLRRAEIGSRIREARMARGLAQDDLAQRAGLRALTISRAELGKSGLLAETAEAIAQALDVSMDWLMRGEGKGPATAAEASS
jgi:transcriptional regulator with XRE-family HTH domain